MKIDFQFPVPLLTDYIFIAVSLILLIVSWYYFLGVFAKVKLTTPPESGFQDPVSIVVAARNELKNLEHNIPIWLGQQYPVFELIIADDGSTDGTSEYLSNLAETDSRIKIVVLDAEYVKMHGKKIALTLAFKKARYNKFILTDADCTPASDQWLRQMAASLSGEKEIVLGFSPYAKKPGGLNRLIRFETVMTALHYLGFAGKGKPYMGVGRNLGYTRAVYDRNRGFSSHAHIPAGDDDLFVQEAATAKNTAICLTPESFTWSWPKSRRSEWRQQKKRHMWVGKFYSPEVKRRLWPYPASQFLFSVSIAGWFFFTAWFVFPLSVLIIRWIPEWIIFGSRTAKLGNKDLRAWYPLLSLYYSFWYLFAGIRAFFAKKPRW